MALIRCMNNRIALLCVDLAYMYETKDGGGYDKIRLAIPEVTTENTSDCRDSDEEENNKSSAKTDRQEEPSFSCANFSPCSTYFMAVTNSKRLIVWKRHGPGNWEAIIQRHVARKSVQTLGGKLIVGRLSMVLDMVIGEQDNFLAVSDRDEKIQVSCYPNCYNIRTFCLGHTQFVTCLTLLPGPPELLVSGSGDGTIRTWCPETGRQLHRYEVSIEKRAGDTKYNVESRKPAVKRLALQPSGTTMACLIDELAEVLLLSWQGLEAGWSRLQRLASSIGAAFCTFHRPKWAVAATGSSCRTLVCKRASMGTASQGRQLDALADPSRQVCSF
ncbi:hypothetical protein MRX96_028485 [Rhipicephalus microplus]